MSYYCTMRDSKFFIKTENFGSVLNLLINNAEEHTVEGDRFISSYQTGDVYMPAGISFKDARIIVESGKIGAQQDLLLKFFLEAGYSIGFDGKGNICSVIYQKSNWYEDTNFFNVFAKFVEKGSFIEMVGENNELWRMYFDGEYCNEINAEIKWPEMNEEDKQKEAYQDMSETHPGLSKARGLAVKICELFEDLLDEHDITIPSDEREGEEGEARLYGPEYYSLKDEITEAISREFEVQEKTATNMSHEPVELVDDELLEAIENDEDGRVFDNVSDFFNYMFDVGWIFNELVGFMPDDMKERLVLETSWNGSVGKVDEKYYYHPDLESLKESPTVSELVANAESKCEEVNKEAVGKTDIELGKD